MELAEIYYYLFYKYYRLFEAFKTTRWLTDVKAAIAVFSLEIWILFSIQFYYNFLTNHRAPLEFFSFKVLVPFIILLIVKWVFFLKDGKWKIYAGKFEQLPASVNKKGDWIIAILTVFCFANLILSLYLNSLIKMQL